MAAEPELSYPFDAGGATPSGAHAQRRISAFQFENQAAQEREEMHCEGQEDIERLNVKLADANRRMAALCAELHEKARQLERADAMKTRILSNISHEFRSPLHSILAITSLLLGHGEAGSSSEQFKLIGYIRNAADSLFNLVNDLLDLAKIASGKMEIHAVEFGAAELFATLRGMLPPPLLKPAVRLIFDVPASVPALYSDQGKITQILRNLIDNGLKFTEQGEVRVSAGYDQSNDTVTFAVRDTGVGIAAPDHEKIFEEFVQLDSPAQDKIKGTGLGLSICRDLATVLGGRISLESELGAGATFLLSVPRRALETGDIASDDESTRAQARQLAG